MNFVAEIPIQWMVLCLLGFMVLQSLLTLRIVRKSNRNRAQAFKNLEKQVREGFDSTSRILCKRITELEKSQREFFRSVDTRLSRLEMRSLSDATRFRPSNSTLDRKHQVVSLAQMGLDVKKISRRLRMSQGETELLLGLKERYRAERENDRALQ